ncbi:CHASE3 domain-containing protein [Brevibacillus brevis]|nr:CHASE3 domain-containing protein [Brevibacillus brevis]
MLAFSQKEEIIRRITMEETTISERQKYARGYVIVGDGSYLTGYSKANDRYKELTAELFRLGMTSEG